MFCLRDALLGLCSFAILLLISARLGAEPLFEDDSVLEVKLTGPFGTTFKDMEDRTERPFIFESAGVEYPVKVRLRGHSRLRVCDFPPLRLNFRKSDISESVFAGQDKLKLVTHCRNYDRAEQNMLEEYAAYRILNVLTDLSYRVRLFRINYADTDGELPETAANHYGFVLETAENLAERIGATPVVMKGVPKRRHDLELAALVYVYQYLIANTDWGLVKADYAEGCCHNIDLFELDNTVLIVPYDLDLSGLVNANYAFPDELLRIKKVTQRLYRGLCTDRAVLVAAIDEVIARETQILDTLLETPGLTEDNRNKATKFLGRFFEQARNKDKLIKNFEKRCIG